MNYIGPLQISARILAPCLSTVVLLTTATAAIADFTPPDSSAPGAESIGTNTSRLYTPPPNPGRPSSRRSGTGVSRGSGCSSASTASLVSFAPQTHVGQTASLQPTFAWFTPDVGDVQVEFRIAEYLPDGEFRVVYSDEFSSTERGPSGITTLSLSETDFSLSANTTYRWQVVLVCNPNRPSESLVTEADIAVVEAPAALETELAVTADSSEKAQLYAGSSLWYDAIAMAIAADPTGETTVTLLSDLAALERQPEDAMDESIAPNIYSDRLQQVIDTIR